MGRKWVEGLQQQKNGFRFISSIGFYVYCCTTDVLV